MSSSSHRTSQLHACGPRRLFVLLLLHLISTQLLRRPVKLSRHTQRPRGIRLIAKSILVQIDEQRSKCGGRAVGERNDGGFPTVRLGIAKVNEGG